MPQQQLLPHVCIVSGPVKSRDQVIGAFAVEGLAAREPDGHGLPSHPDPLTAHAAGAPNSGHTPGTPHPETLDFAVLPGEHKADKAHPCTRKDCEHVGQTETRPNPLSKHHGKPYEDDPSVAFLAVEHDDPSQVARIVEAHGWVLRMHVSPVLQTVEELLAPEQRLARVEQDLAILRGEVLA